MITRRGLLKAGGTAIGAVALARPGVASPNLPETASISLSSRARPLAPSLQGQRHVVLSGDRLLDLAEMDRIVADRSNQRMVLALDAADQVMMDVALQRSTEAFAVFEADAGLIEVRRTTLAGV